jgi:hypothetical protein
MSLWAAEALAEVVVGPLGCQTRLASSQMFRLQVRAVWSALAVWLAAREG